MTDIVQPNPDNPDEPQLTETPETLSAISDLFERMADRAKQLFTTKEDMTRAKDDSRWVKTRHEYDRFAFESGSIVLYGSYYDRCDGNQETYCYVGFEDFFDPTYLDRERAKLDQLKADIAEKKRQSDAAVQARQNAADREQYALLHAKFGTNDQHGE